MIYLRIRIVESHYDLHKFQDYEGYQLAAKNQNDAGSIFL